MPDFNGGEEFMTTTCIGLLQSNFMQINNTIVLHCLTISFFKCCVTSCIYRVRSPRPSSASTSEVDVHYPYHAKLVSLVPSQSSLRMLALFPVQLHSPHHRGIHGSMPPHRSPPLSSGWCVSHDFLSYVWGPKEPHPEKLRHP